MRSPLQLSCYHYPFLNSNHLCRCFLPSALSTKLFLPLFSSSCLRITSEGSASPIYFTVVTNRLLTAGLRAVPIAAWPMAKAMQNASLKSEMCKRTMWKCCRRRLFKCSRAWMSTFRMQKLVDTSGGATASSKHCTHTCFLGTGSSATASRTCQCPHIIRSLCLSTL